MNRLSAGRLAAETYRNTRYLQESTAVAEQIANTARSNVPVDTGELRDNIEVEPATPDSRAKAIVRGEHSTSNGGPPSVAVTVEFGTEYRSPIPFMRNAGEVTASANGMRIEPHQ